MVAHFAPPFELEIVGVDNYGPKHLMTLTSYVVPQIGSTIYLPPPAYSSYRVRKVTYDFEKGKIGVDVDCL